MREMISVLAVGMALLAGSALVAGCGGGDSTTNGGDEIASKGAGTEGTEGEAPASPSGPTNGGEAGGGESSGGGSAKGGESSGGGEAAGDKGGESSPNGGGSAGGSESSGAGKAGREAPASTPKSDFAAEASALCKKQRRRMKARVNAIFNRSREKGSEAQQAAALRKLVTEAIAPGMEREVEGLQGLDAPKGSEGKVEELIDALEAIVAEAREDPKAFLGNPAAFDGSGKLAREAGISVCGTLS